MPKKIKTNAQYLIRLMRYEPELTGSWNGPAWKHINPVHLSHCRPESSDHRPATYCKLQYSSRGLYGIFKVQDNYIRCVHETFQSDVYKDSCVEIFLQPKSETGYFNFEFNCGGSLLATYITDPTRVDGKIKYSHQLPPDADQKILRFHSLPAFIEPEHEGPKTWYLEFFIPFSVMEEHVGELDTLVNWKGNIYKCGDETSHPHWISWSVLDELNFHAPENFGDLIFDHGEVKQYHGVHLENAIASG